VASKPACSGLQRAPPGSPCSCAGHWQRRGESPAPTQPRPSPRCSVWLSTGSTSCCGPSCQSSSSWLRWRCVAVCVQFAYTTVGSRWIRLLYIYIDGRTEIFVNFRKPRRTCKRQNACCMARTLDHPCCNCSSSC